jgi:hypothetical protein
MSFGGGVSEDSVSGSGCERKVSLDEPKSWLLSNRGDHVVKET